MPNEEAVMSNEESSPKKVSNRQLAMVGFVAGILTVALITFIYL